MAADTPDTTGRQLTAYVHFTVLREGLTSVADLLELTDRHRTLVLVGVPDVAAAGEDAWRFANPIDICWERDVRLVVLAPAEPQ